ncbi:MAG: C39 family peptidase [Deltaproteobacteria bacterium]|nr:C39 family peptidase [Deltaproteobacteria bacterium]
MTALEVPVLVQPTGYECGNTSLAAVFQFFGKQVTIAEAGALAKTTEDGTDHHNLIAAARATGARVIARSNGTIAELAWFVARGVPPIVGWWMEGDRDWDRRWSAVRRKRKDCGHYSVVTAVTSEHVVLIDPHGACGARRFTHEGFARVWYDTDTALYRHVVRWFLAMSYV